MSEPQHNSEAKSQNREAVSQGFGSDNHSGTHPRIMAAIANANEGHVPSYGTDPLTLRATELMKGVFGPEAETHFVFNGTAANVLALSCVLKPHHAVLASEHAHLINDECGAPERAWGAKIVSVPSPDAKLTPESLERFLVRRGDQHYSQIKAVSITQPTELGTVYTVDEIRALSTFTKKHGLVLHVDGARLVNAAASLNCTLKEMTTDAGVDVVSVGGTKNGLMFGEAVVFLRAGMSSDFKYSRKQLMQLPSKTRFLAAQFLEFLGTDLWIENARHANRLARRLSEGLAKSPYARLTQTTQANACFVVLPKGLVPRLRERYFFYVWNEHTFECRLMTSWDTSENDVDGFLSALDELGRAFNASVDTKTNSESPGSNDR